MFVYICKDTICYMLYAIYSSKHSFGQQYSAGEYDTIIGLDPGYKLFIGAVIKNLKNDDEEAVKISTKEFYSMTKQNIWDKTAKRLTSDFEDEAKLDRENSNIYQQYPSPKSRLYMQYIEHRLKIFKSGIDIYTTLDLTSINIFLIRKQWILSSTNSLAVAKMEESCYVLVPRNSIQAVQ